MIIFRLPKFVMDHLHYQTFLKYSTGELIICKLSIVAGEVVTGAIDGQGHEVTSGA